MEESGISTQSSSAPPARPAQRRPRDVVIGSIALVVIGVLGLLEAWLLLSVLSDDADHGQSVSSAWFGLCYLQFALSGTQLLSGLLIWRGRLPWTRIAAIAICVVNLLGGVVTLFSGNVVPGIFGVVVNGALIRLLTKDDVYDWCHRPR
jgi:hypothetical protein